ncbi:MAG: septum formation protein Maf [Clostridiales bacterium]|jgi:septum formation protein|nr:septum formation protein Maf [Clostridiales bacterium]
MKLILASASPRRVEILKSIIANFEVIPADIDEEPKINQDVNKEDLCVSLALKKAQAVFEKFGNIALGADTLVFLDKKILGKPRSKEQAFKTLKQLSGKTHAVITGVALVSAQRTITDYDQSFVTFPNLDERDILDYIEKYKPYDKAGAYGIQEIKDIWDIKYTGSYTNILGLPAEKVKQMLSFLEGILCQR